MRVFNNFLAAAFALVLEFTAIPAEAQKSQPSLKLSTVVIDAGHGGKDVGCMSPDNKTMEKTLVLDIAKRLSEKIKAGYPDVKVIMTRDSDKFVELQERANIANRNKANLFISIHINSVDGKKSGPNGYSVHILGQYNSRNKDLYAGNMSVVQRENSVIKLEDDYSAKYDGFDPSDPESFIFMNLMQNAFLAQSLEFASAIDEAMSGCGIKNSRGISQDPFLVLWKTAMPSVLVECGFMSNPEDRQVLKSEEGRENIASGIYAAFKKYKKGYDGSTAIERESAQKLESAPSKEDSPAKEVAEDEFYGTQVLVSSKDMKEDDPFFKGHDVKKVLSGKYYKYIIGTSDDLQTAKTAFDKINKYFPDSFLVKVSEGQVARVR